MSTSTDGQLCFGLLFTDAYEFPWDATQKYEDLEEWWLRDQGWVPPFQLYNDEGNYAFQATQEQKDQYYTSYNKFLEEHPIPVKLVNYCSGEFPMYILAVPHTVVVANRGYPKVIDPILLSVGIRDKEALRCFCDDHDLHPENQTAQWYLSSHWG